MWKTPREIRLVMTCSCDEVEWTAEAEGGPKILALLTGRLPCSEKRP